MYSKQLLKNDEIEIEYCGNRLTGVIKKKEIRGLNEAIEFYNKAEPMDRYKLDLNDKGLKILSRKRAPNLLNEAKQKRANSS